MTPAQAQKAIERIVTGPGSKADRARALFTLGLVRSEVVELIGMTYSQAHGIYKRLQDGQDHPDPVQGEARQDHRHENGKGAHPAGLRLSPSQVRIATQDGHEVIRVDKQGGTTCRNCDRKLVYSIEWLAFVHAASKKDPTELEDRYVD